MRPQMLGWFTFGLSLAVGVLASAGDAKEDATKLQGTWAVDPAMYKEVKDEEAVKAMKAVRVIFEGDTVTFKHPPGNEEKAGFHLDPTRKPKQIDMSNGVQGIYELKGDSLRLCWDQQAKTNGRPTKFAHDKDKASVHYLILKREKK
jgi:uncharacterized protein (TIGR03067 family)